MNCAVCTYLDILESTAPSERVMAAVRDERANHVCREVEPKFRAHPNTMIGKR